jgi:alpha-tubulin suppressor-like RCC1 family protein
MYRLEQFRIVYLGRRRLVLILAAAAMIVSSVAYSSSASADPFGGASWGYNASGQLGNNSTVISRVPVTVQGLTGVIAVSAGGEHSLALLANGTVMAWGSNREGQLGNGNTTSSHVPQIVPGLSGVSAIAAGKEHSLALLSSGTVMAWGNNEVGQLGSGSKAAKSAIPVVVKGLSGVTAIAAGGEHSLARLSSGTVMAWGGNGEGQLGNGKMANSNVPVTVKGLSSATAVAAGGEHSLALLTNGTVMAWGSNEALQLGAEGKKIKVGGGGPEEEPEYEEVQIENSNVPVPVQALSGAVAVAAGTEHSLALLGNGTVMAWGSNHADQLGNGSAGGNSSFPTAVTGLSAVTAIAAGNARHSLARLSNGTIEAWGYNPDGQLGNGLNINSPVPITVNGLGQVAGIATGGSHSLSFGPPAPSISSVSPNTGPQPGGTSVTITGANFTGATAVSFGPSAAASFTVNSATSITAVSPAGTRVVDVSVTTPVTTSAGSTADKFTYMPPPTVTKVKLNKGPAAGGTSVTITGTNFTGATAVSFGAIPAASFTVNSATSITTASPAGTTGTVDITVTTSSGTSAISTKDHFKYESPTITSISPNTGPVAGGTTVTIIGSGFALGSATVFKFGKSLAGSVECTSTSTCTMVTTAAKKAGVVEVKATVEKSSSKKSPLSDQFTYQ